MALADVAKKQPSRALSVFSSLLNFETNSPVSLLSLAAIGPCFLMISVALSSGVRGLPGLSCALAFFSMILLLKWRVKGLFGAVTLVAMTYLARVVLGSSTHTLWELGFFLSTGTGVFVSHQCFEECIEKYENETLSVTEDFERLKEVHATYTHEKAVECERLKHNVAESSTVIEECREEISSLKNVVSASSAQASSFAQKNRALQEKAFELHKEMVELKAKKFPPAINPKLLKELNTLRVDSFQQKKLIEQVLQVVHPLQVDTLPQAEKVEAVIETPAPVEKIETMEAVAENVEVVAEVIAEVPETTSVRQEEPAPEVIETVVEAPAELDEVTQAKELLSSKEKEKAQVKKVYYEQLDTCNALKAAYSKDLSNEAAKQAYDEENAVLKQKKAELVVIEKELFSLKKELRDQGKLFS